MFESARECQVKEIYSQLLLTKFQKKEQRIILRIPHMNIPCGGVSGMENRSQISPRTISKHVIPFEKLSKNHAFMLLKKYLTEYRINTEDQNELFPFTEQAVNKIGELSEFNAAKILKMAYEILEKAAVDNEQKVIDEKYLQQQIKTLEGISEIDTQTIDSEESIDLRKKAENKN